MYTGTLGFLGIKRIVQAEGSVLVLQLEIQGLETSSKKQSFLTQVSLLSKQMQQSSEPLKAA